MKESDKLGSWCSRERPVVIDVGTGVGAVASVGGTECSCDAMTRILSYR